MVPILSKQKVKMLDCTPDTPNTLEAAGAVTNWITPVLVVGTVSVAAMGTLLMIRRIKKIKHYRLAREKNPTLSWAAFSRRWRMSPAKRIEEDELQRAAMLEKALAQRWEQRVD